MVVLVTPPDQFYIDRGRPLPRDAVAVPFERKVKKERAPALTSTPAATIKPNTRERARNEVDLEIIARHEKGQAGRRIALYMNLSTRRVQSVINAFKAELKNEQAQD